MNARTQLENLNLSALNRFCIAIAFGCGLGLIVDLIISLSSGGYYQYIRHSLGFVIIALVLLAYVRIYRRSLELIAECSAELVNEYAPKDWSHEEREKLLSNLPYEGLALRFTLLGMRAMTLKLRKALLAR